jgi:hypothetical protein
LDELLRIGDVESLRYFLRALSGPMEHDPTMEMELGLKIQSVNKKYCLI